MLKSFSHLLLLYWQNLIRGINHGTFLHIAHEEVQLSAPDTFSIKRNLHFWKGLILNSSIHAGVRAPTINKKKDLRNDKRCGFEIVKARDIDRIGIQGVITALKERVGNNKVYISVDIDVLDPAFAPGTFICDPETLCDISWPSLATGTAEPGGWSTRELLSIIDGLKGLQVVGADVVEVAPIYDNPGETTVLAAAEVVYSLLALMVQEPIKEWGGRG